jgi:hypothetical protein
VEGKIAMFINGQKVVCIDDKFPSQILNTYTALPKEGAVYVVRGMAPGNDLQLNPELTVYLVGLHNPCSDCPPHREWGFKAERFRPLDEMTEQEILALGKPLEVHAA